MNNRTHYLGATLAAIAIFYSGNARAQETTETSPSIGISMSAEISSIYNFRGMNTFMDASLADQHGFFAPGIAVGILDTGISLGYWGAYQINGNNVTQMIKAGLGCEQDIFLGFNYELIDDTLNLGATLTYIFYPFANENEAGTINPSYIEPLISLEYTGILNAGLKVSYFFGIQNAIELYRYLYLNPYLGKTISLSARYAFNVGLSFGYKLFNEMNLMKDNVYDLRFDWTLPIQLTKTLHIEPGVHLSWTNIDTTTTLISDDTGEMQEVTKPGTAADGFMVYASLGVGLDL